METTLHKQLKDVFCVENSQIEVPWGRYRIDVVTQGRLIEIQHSGLASIRDKVKNLMSTHKIDVVKPIIARKKIIQLDQRDGVTLSQRWSPLKRTPLYLFEELLHFTQVFPHKNLRLIVPLIEVEETRFPGHGRRRRWRKNDFQIADQTLIHVLNIDEYRTIQDLCRLLPPDLPRTFDTADLATALSIQRHHSQRIAYVLRKTGSAIEVGKAGNRILYKLCRQSKKKQSKSQPASAAAPSLNTPKRAASQKNSA